MRLIGFVFWKYLEKFKDFLAQYHHHAKISGIYDKLCTKASIANPELLLSLYQGKFIKKKEYRTWEFLEGGSC